MDIDLNINNYKYDELLNIYKIDNTYNLENIELIKKKLNLIKNNYSKEIYDFFYKVYVSISCIYKLFDLNVIPVIEDSDNVDTYFHEIKKIKNFEQNSIDFTVTNIVEKLKPTPKILKTDNELANGNRSLYNNLKTNNISNTFPNVLAPGNINSIKRINQFLNLYLNSCFRSNYFKSNSTDFQYIIPSEIKNVTSMRLASIEIPNSLYLISEYNKNNFFKISATITNNSKIESEIYIIKIPDGNYTAKTLEDYLNNAYFYKSHDVNGNGNAILKNIRFYINEYNDKCTFEIINNESDNNKNGNNNNIKLSFLFSEDYNENPLSTFGWLCGFRQTRYLDIESCITSEGLFDNGNDRYIYIIINDYQYNNNTINIVGFDKSILNENVIAKIPLKNNKFSLIFNNDNDPLSKIRRYNGPVNIAKLHIKLIDKFGIPINLNNMDISLTLEFEILYESFNFSNISD